MPFKYSFKKHIPQIYTQYFHNSLFASTFTPVKTPLKPRNTRPREPMVHATWCFFYYILQIGHFFVQSVRGIEVLKNPYFFLNQAIFSYPQKLRY